MRTQREYPSRPFVGVGVLIHRRGKILMLRRRFEPNKGGWTLPGGLVEKGERLEETAVREAREELGIEVRLEGLINVATEIVRDGEDVRFHFVIVDYLAVPVGEKISLNGESSSYRWVEPREVGRMKTSTNIKDLVRKYAASEDGAGRPSLPLGAE